MPTGEKSTCPAPKKGVLYLLTFWSMMGVLVMGAFFMEGIAFFSDHPTAWMNDGEFFVSLVATLTSVVCFLVLAHRNFKIPFHWTFAIVFFILFLGNTVGLLNLDLVIESSDTFIGVRAPYLYTVSAIPRLRFALSWGVTCIYLYLFFAVFPKCFHNHRRLHLVCYAVIITMFAAIIYSLIAEFDLYRCLWDPTLPWDIHNCQSFTNNPNTYSFFFVLGAIAIAIVHNRRSHWWWPLLLTLVALFAFVHGSGTGAVCTGFVAIAFFIYRFILTVEKHPVRAVLVFFLFVAMVLTLTVLVAIDAGEPGTVLHNFISSIRNNVFGVPTLVSRVEIWSTVFKQLDSPLKWLFGLGDQQVYYYLGATMLHGGANETFHVHNGFIQQIYAGGLLRLCVYIALVVRFFVLGIDASKRRTRVAWPCMIGMGAFLIRGVFETNSFLAADSISAVCYLLIILPLEVDRYLAKNPKIEKAEDFLIQKNAKRVHYRYEYSPLRRARLAFLFITPPVCVAFGVIPVYFTMGYFLGYAGWTYYMLWAELFLFFPLVWYFSGHYNGLNRTGVGGVMTVLFLGLFVAGLLTPKHYPFVTYAIVAILPVLPFLLFPFAAKSVVVYRSHIVFNTYLPYIGVALTLIGISSLAHAIPVQYYSIYNPIMMIIFVVTGYFAIMYLPFMDTFVYPLKQCFYHFDERLTIKSIVKERRYAAKQDAYMAKEVHKEKPVTYHVHY